MSWLEDLIYTHRYVCDDGHESRYEFSAVESPNNKNDVSCEHEGCELDATYQGFLPQEMHITGRVTYDQNGRKAIRITDGKGGVQHISQTKARFLETGIIEHEYTDDYKAKLKQDEERNAHLLGTDFNRRMAQVTAYSGKPKPSRKAAP